MKTGRSIKQGQAFVVGSLKRGLALVLSLALVLGMGLQATAFAASFLSEPDPNWTKEDKRNYVKLLRYQYIDEELLAMRDAGELPAWLEEAMQSAGVFAIEEMTPEARSSWRKEQEEKRQYEINIRAEEVFYSKTGRQTSEIYNMRGEWSEDVQNLVVFLAGGFRIETLQEFGNDPKALEKWGFSPSIIVVGPGQVVDEMEIGEGQILINFGEIKSVTATGNAVYVASGGSKTGTVTLSDTAVLHVADGPSSEEAATLVKQGAIYNTDISKQVRISSVTATGDSKVYLGNKANVASLIIEDNAAAKVHPDGFVWGALADDESSIVTGEAGITGFGTTTPYERTVKPLPEKGDTQAVDEIADGLSGVMPPSWAEADKLLLAEVISGKYTAEELTALRAAGALPEWLELILSGETVDAIRISGEQIAANLGGIVGAVYTKDNAGYVAINGATTGYLAMDHNSWASIINSSVAKTLVGGNGNLILGDGATADRVFGAKNGTIEIIAGANAPTVFLQDGAKVSGAGAGTTVHNDFYMSMNEVWAEKEAERLTKLQAEIDAYNAAYDDSRLQNTAWDDDSGSSGGSDSSSGRPGTDTNTNTHDHTWQDMGPEYDQCSTCHERQNKTVIAP
ncbi:hypothetical protein LJC74_06725 [Eubacteriales bacterium OttesenSCG-928-A19]|nr:hypothetical protein [Eubacteriales bacterium OttesenSCG-928-A19]